MCRYEKQEAKQTNSCLQAGNKNKFILWKYTQRGRNIQSIWVANTYSKKEHAENTDPGQSDWSKYIAGG